MRNSVMSLQGISAVTFRWFLSSALWLLAATLHAQPVVKPLPFEATVGASALDSQSGIELSPDGQWLAYTVAATDDSKKDVWVVNLKSRAPVRIGEAGNAWGPRWSPDGRQLAFYSDGGGGARLWVWDRPSQRAREVSDTAVSSWVLDVLQWSHDSRFILVRIPRDHGGKNAAQLVTAAPEPTVSVYGAGLDPGTAQALGVAGAGKTGEITRWGLSDDLAMVDIEQGTVRRLFENTRDLDWDRIFLSPKDHYVVYPVRTKVRPNSYDLLYDIWLTSIPDGKSRRIAQNIALNVRSMGIAWSPDERYVAYTEFVPTPPGAHSDGDQMQAFIVPVKVASAPRNITPPRTYLQKESRPVWEKDGRSVICFGEAPRQGTFIWRLSVDGDAAHAREIAILPEQSIAEILVAEYSQTAWAPDGGDSLAVLAYNSAAATSGIYRVNLRTGRVNPLVAGAFEYGEASSRYMQLSVIDGDPRVAVTAESVQAPEELWLINSRNGARVQLTQLNPALADVAMGQGRSVTWTGRDGKPAQGLLLLPSDYHQGRRYPLITFVYGPAMAYANHFGFWRGFFNMQLFATRGYAVLYPDIHWRPETVMQGIADTTLPGIDAIVADGIADHNRLGLFGQSSGGYDVLALLVQSTRFAAAAESAGPSNMFQEYAGALRSQVGITWVETQMRLGGDPWNYRDRYVANSPWFFLDRVTTPLLILQGAEDSIVPSSDAVFVGLRALNKPVVYAKYDKEGHSETYWSPVNRSDAARRMFDWFDRYLQPGH
jgi:dipeptidyl aminopeptidase/acylaminoacyl peptidase